MSIDKSKIENNKKIILGVLLLTSSIIGGLGYYFASNKKPSEELTQKIIEENQETESDNQNNNKKNIENQSEITINNEYIPIIDNLWLNISAFVFFSIFTIALEYFVFISAKNSLASNMGWLRVCSQTFAIFIIDQIILCLIWFIFIMFLTDFSESYDKKHSWWSKFKRGLFKNRIYFKGGYFWIFWLLDFFVNIIIAGLIFFFINVFFKKESPEQH